MSTTPAFPAVPGVRVGHWTDSVARTGCTVVRFPEGTTASGEVRGGAPATREFELLDPRRTVKRIDALVLTGGSAFGLAAADGVMQTLAGEGVGFPTGGGPVPIVVALGLFDLAVGDGSVRPGPAEGAAACDTATETAVVAGAIGAGCGATVGKWAGAGGTRGGGLCSSVVVERGVTVAALLAVNAYGGIGLDPAHARPRLPASPPEAGFGNTTIGLVVTDARIDKLGCRLVAESAHDGLARSIDPVHTASDGDAFVVAATGVVAAEVELVRSLAAIAVRRAVLSLG